MNNPTTSQKYLALAVILPVLADFIEDLRDTNIFKHKLKMKANLLIEEIRIADSKFYERRAFSDLTDEEYVDRITQIANQQSIGGIAFRQWVAQEFFDPYEQSSVHSNDSNQSEEQEGDKDHKEESISSDTEPTKKNSTRGRKQPAKKNSKE